MISMKIFICDGLPFDIQQKVHKNWVSRYQYSFDPKNADIVLSGLKPINCGLYFNTTYFVTNCTNGDHIVNKQSHQKILTLAEHTDKMEDVTSTAEHTMMLILMLARRYFKQAEYWDRYEYLGNSLQGKTLGIIGYGRIGKKVAHLASAFGMNVMAFDKKGYTTHSKTDVLMKSDFLTLHNSVQSTNPIIDQVELHLMKTGAFLINTTRGICINEIALLKQAKKFSGIALDVLQGEPSPVRFKQFKKLPNCIVTPHIGGNTIEDLKKTSELLFKIFIKEYDDQTTESQLNS